MISIDLFMRIIIGLYMLRALTLMSDGITESNDNELSYKMKIKVGFIMFVGAMICLMW